jgi:hypothetical protein
MDRTNAISRLNTEEIVNEVNNVIKKGLDKLLGDHLYRYELLEKTHDAIMNLPSVRNHLNQDPLPQYKVETKVDDVNNKMIEKLLKRIDELTFEVNQLKQASKKEFTDIRLDDEVKVVKLEQKENITLEIEDNICHDDVSSVASSVASSEEEEDDVSEVEDDISEQDDTSEENICSECDCKVILKEDIIIVDGKKFCGACDPTSNEEEVEEDSSDNEEEVEVENDEVETEKSEEDEEPSEEEETVVNLEEEEEEEYIEIDIDDITYCTNNEENGFIYEVTEDGDLGDKVGYLKDGEPFFYADEIFYAGEK